MDRFSFKQLLLEYTIEDIEKIYGQWASKAGLDLKDTLDRLHKLWGDESEIPFYILTKVLSAVKNEMKRWNSVSAKDIETFLNLTINLEGLRIMHEIRNSGKQAINKILTDKELELIDKFAGVKTINELNTIAKAFAKLKSKWITYKKYQNLNKTRVSDFKTDSARIYKVKNFEEMKKLGYGAQWCVTMTTYWDVYSRFSDLYVIIPNDRKVYSFENTTLHTKYLISLLKQENMHLLTWWMYFAEDLEYFKNKLKDWDMWVTLLMRDAENEFHYLLDNLFDDYVADVEEILNSNSDLEYQISDVFYSKPEFMEEFLKELAYSTSEASALYKAMKTHLPPKLQQEINTIQDLFTKWRRNLGSDRPKTIAKIVNQFLKEMASSFIRYNGIDDDLHDYVNDFLNVAGAEYFDEVENFNISIFFQIANEQDYHEQSLIQPAIDEIKKVPELFERYKEINGYMESEIIEAAKIFLEDQFNYIDRFLTTEIYHIMNNLYENEPEIKNNVNEYANIIQRNYKILADLDTKLLPTKLFPFKDFLYGRTANFMSENIRFEYFPPDMVAKYLPQLKQNSQLKPETIKALENVAKSASPSKD